MIDIPEGAAKSEVTADAGTMIGFVGINSIAPLPLTISAAGVGAGVGL